MYRRGALTLLAATVAVLLLGCATESGPLRLADDRPLRNLMLGGFEITTPTEYEAAFAYVLRGKISDALYNTLSARRYYALFDSARQENVGVLVGNCLYENPFAMNPPQNIQEQYRASVFQLQKISAKQYRASIAEKAPMLDDVGLLWVSLCLHSESGLYTSARHYWLSTAALVDVWSTQSGRKVVWDHENEGFCNWFSNFGEDERQVQEIERCTQQVLLQLFSALPYGDAIISEVPRQ